MGDRIKYIILLLILLLVVVVVLLYNTLRYFRCSSHGRVRICASAAREALPAGHQAVRGGRGALPHEPLQPQPLLRVWRHPAHPGRPRRARGGRRDAAGQWRQREPHRRKRPLSAPHCRPTERT